MVRLSLISLFLLPTLVACGSEKPERPSREAILAQLTVDNSVQEPASVLSCQARVLEESSLSDDALLSFVGVKSGYTLTASEEETLAEGGDAWRGLQTCRQNR